MAKKGSDSGVYRVIDVIGTSAVSWEDAAKNAVTTASKSLRDLRIAATTLQCECPGLKSLGLLRIANVPARGLSDVTMERLLAASHERKFR